MQLKIQRSQREGGVVSKSVIFCLDARVEFTAAEQASITRYKLHKQVIYNSEASKRHLDSAAGHQEGNTLGGNLRSLASVAMAALNLNISIESLQRGQHVECKSMDELLGAEEAIMTACRNLKSYLETAATFDGREVLIDFDSDRPTVIATSTPALALVSPPVPQAVAPALPPTTQAQPLRTSQPTLAAPIPAGTPYPVDDEIDPTSRMSSPIVPPQEEVSLTSVFSDPTTRLVVTFLGVVSLLLIVLVSCSILSGPS